jgi:hypothetical protein
MESENYWSSLFLNSFKDTWDVVVEHSDASLVVLIFIEAVILISKFDKWGKPMKRAIIEILRVIAITSGMFLIIFLFHLFVLTPAKLYSQLNGTFLAAKSELEATKNMTITVLVTNSSKSKIEINGKFSGEFIESIGGSESSYMNQGFLLFPKNNELEESAFIIPASESREYEVRISDDRRSLYERGASDFIFSLYDGNGKVDVRIPFNQDSIHAQKAIVDFKQ